MTEDLTYGMRSDRTDSFETPDDGDDGVRVGGDPSSGGAKPRCAGKAQRSEPGEGDWRSYTCLVSAVLQHIGQTRREAH